MFRTELDSSAAPAKLAHALVKTLLERVGPGLSLMRMRQSLPAKTLERQIAEQGICKGEREGYNMSLLANSPLFILKTCVHLNQVEDVLNQKIYLILCFRIYDGFHFIY